MTAINLGLKKENLIVNKTFETGKFPTVFGRVRSAYLFLGQCDRGIQIRFAILIQHDFNEIMAKPFRWTYQAKLLTQ